ncbi:MAG: hypothetical protein ABW157_19795 [Candidatus Thiodiazotropha sp. LLP2]
MYQIIVLLLTLMLLLNGCATTQQKTVEIDHTNSVVDANILVIAPQERVIGTVHEINTDQSTLNSIQGQTGLFGVMVAGVFDAVRNANAASRMNKRMEPINNITSDLNFKKDLISKLQEKLIFTSPERIRIIEKPEYQADLIEMIKQSEGPTIVIQSSYGFDANYRILVMDNHISLWLDKSSSPLYKTTVSYYSKPITPFIIHTTPSLGDALLLRAPDELLSDVYTTNINLWASKRASIYRKHYTEGIKESVNMISEALLNKYDKQSLTNKPISTFVDYHGKPYISWGRRFDHVTVGRVIKEQDNRQWLLSENGDFSTYYKGPLKKIAKKKSYGRYQY